MADLAVLAGLPLREVAALDEDEYTALYNAVVDNAKMKTWRTSEELMAVLIDTINALRAELRSGVPVIQIERSMQIQQPDPFPRPEWVNGGHGSSDEGTTVVLSPRDLARKMMKKR